MHPFIHQHQSAIAELCRRYRVQRLEVFGSAARGTDFAPESSDADFLVEPCRVRCAYHRALKGMHSVPYETGSYI